MTDANPNGPPTSARSGVVLLRRSGLCWFLVAALGQTAFIWMIVAHYGRKTLASDFAGWNDKPLIKGYVPGDDAGNLMFGVHVLLAAVVTLGGLEWPSVYRHRLCDGGRRTVDDVGKADLPVADIRHSDHPERRVDSALRHPGLPDGESPAF